MCRLHCESSFLTIRSLQFNSSVGPASIGELLTRADADFDVLVLADKNLRYQQNLAKRTPALVELPTNRWPVLEPLGIQVAIALHGTVAGSYVIVERRWCMQFELLC